MSTRDSIDAQLEKLSGMLPIWLEKMRHSDQFWPQFDALAQEILDDAHAEEVDDVKGRLASLLNAHGMVRPGKFGGETSGSNPA